MGTGSVGTGQASNQTRLGRQGVHQGRPPRARPRRLLLRRRRPVRLARLPPRGPQGRPPRQVRDPDQDPRHQRSPTPRATSNATGWSWASTTSTSSCSTACRRPAGRTSTPGSMEYLMQAKEEKIIRAHGTSCHGMDPLRTAAKNPFVEVDLARINPEGLIMDDKKPDEVASRLEEMHDAGKGVIGMKILGEGRIKDARAPGRLAPLRPRPGHRQRLHHRLRDRPTRSTTSSSAPPTPSRSSRADRRGQNGVRDAPACGRSPRHHAG